jgi:hypothetical protein
MNRKLVFWLSLIVALLVVGCSGGNSDNNSSSSSSGTAEDGAKAYLNAALGGQGDASTLLCSTLPADTKQQMQSAFDTMRSTYTATGATLDLSGLTYTSHDVSGDTAQVDVAGKIKVTVNGTSNEVDYPQSTIQMKNENGWKVCG